jgi:hypothetical protein
MSVWEPGDGGVLELSSAFLANKNFLSRGYTVLHCKKTPFNLLNVMTSTGNAGRDSGQLLEPGWGNLGTQTMGHALSHQSFLLTIKLSARPLGLLTQLLAQCPRDLRPLH